jgi:4-hydroxybenzoate polyprenyltransferase
VLLVALFSVFWLAGFDIIYATLDEDFDRQAGVKSLPAHMGSAKALKVAALFHFLAFVSLVVLYGVWLGGPLTVMMLAIIAVLLFLEQYFSSYVDFSFFHVNVWIGVAVLIFIMTGVKGV